MRIQIPNPNVFPVLDWGLPTSPCPRIGRGAGVCRCADADAADAVVVGQIGPSNSGLQLFVGDVCWILKMSFFFACTFELSILPSKFFRFGPLIRLLFPCHSFARGLTVSLVLWPELIQRPTEHSRAFETVVSSIIILSGWARSPLRRNMVTPHVTAKATPHSCRVDKLIGWLPNTQKKIL